MRRLRTDQLDLVRTDGTSSVLFTATREPGEVTTQDIFQVSPDGAYLAYIDDGSLHLRAADGIERTFDDYRGLMRFSPDARYLAAAIAGHVQLVDLAYGTTRDLATAPPLRQIEWVRDGLVALTDDSLIEMPLVGPQTTLLGHASIERFVTAGTGTRVVAFVREPDVTRIVAFDGGTRRELGTSHEPTTNAAASLDGTHVAFTTSEAVFALDGDAAPQPVAPESYVHSLWYARDGRLGYATAWATTIGGQKFPSNAGVNMLRFDPLTGDGLVAQANRLGLDHFAGGYVEWIVR